MAKETT